MIASGLLVWRKVWEGVEPQVRLLQDDRDVRLYDKRRFSQLGLLSRESCVRKRSLPCWTGVEQSRAIVVWSVLMLVLNNEERRYSIEFNLLVSSHTKRFTSRREAKANGLNNGHAPLFFERVASLTASEMKTLLMHTIWEWQRWLIKYNEGNILFWGIKHGRKRLFLSAT